MTDPNTITAHARRLFDPSGWKEKTYGDPTVRVLILPGEIGESLSCPRGPTHPDISFFQPSNQWSWWNPWRCFICGRPHASHLGRWGSLLDFPRPVAEVADAVLTYEARLAALASPGRIS